MNEVITRRKTFENKKFWISTNSSEAYAGNWQNCLYLHFAKEDFPLVKSPPLVECDWTVSKKRFDYYQSVLSELDWHGGITFYEETLHVENGRTYVKAGCDYSHYRDDAYMSGDYGKSILEIDGEEIAREFEKLYARIEKESEGAV